MTLIKPPNDYGQPRPDNPVHPDEHRRIELFFRAKSWKCHECGTVNCGWNLECVICKMKLGKHTPRPPHYKKSEGIP